MVSPLQNLRLLLLLLLLFLSLLLLLPPCLGLQVVANTSLLTYHGGPLLTGKLNLAFIWYGRFGRKQKSLMRAFVKSLNAYNHAQPQVSEWWSVVEGYQEAVGKRPKPIQVRVKKQISDNSYSMGHVITDEYVQPLIQKVSGPRVAVVFTAKDVSVQGLCTGKCAAHGISDDRPYLIVGNPEIECPKLCAWPFHKPDKGFVGDPLKPPSGNMAADAMVTAFAQGLVELVTNPNNTGFFQDHIRDPIEASVACRGIFGSGASQGSTGKILIDPVSGGGYNANGSKKKKFLLPSFWNPKTKSCYTII